MFTPCLLFTQLLILSALSSPSLGQFNQINRQSNRPQPDVFNQRRSSTTERTSLFTTSTTTVSTLEGNGSDNVTDSKFILSLLKPSKETTLNQTGSVGSSFISGDAIKNTLSTFLLQTDTCFGKVAGWSDPVLGNFTTTGDSPYCDSKCTRNFFCCAPFKPDQADVKFIFSTNENDGKYVGPGDTELRSFLQRSNKPVAFIIHGYLNNYQFDSYFNETKDGLIKKGYNVFVVDWARANRAYLQSIANVRVVGAMVGHFIRWLEIPDRSSCIGFSLGSHICGEAGKWLRERQLTLSRCHGIDPAGPAYDGCGPELRLDPSDCGVVTAVHTSGYLSPSSLIKEGLGTTEKTGHCDFWVNHGVYQPNCDNGTILGFKLDLLLGKFGKFAQKVEHGLLCSHTRAMYYLVNQVNGICNFVGNVARGCGDGKECEVVRSKRFSEFDEDSHSETTAGPYRRPGRPGGNGQGDNWGSSGPGHGNDWSSSDSGHNGQGNDWNQGERWPNRPNQGSNNEIGSSGSNRPNGWNQGHNSYSTTERPYGSGTSNYNRHTSTTYRPGSWNQGHHSNEKYSTRRPDLIASSSNNNDRWTSRPPFGGSGNGDGYTSSTTSSYDSDSDYSTRRPSNNNNNNNNRRTTTSRPFSGNGYSSTSNYDSDYTSRRPGSGWDNDARPTNERPNFGRPESGRPSRPSSGNGFESENGRPDQGRPSNGRPNLERPNNGRPDFERPNNGRPGRPGNGFEPDRPNERPPFGSGQDGWNQGGGGSSERPPIDQGRPQRPLRPGGGNNGGRTPMMMGIPPDDSCTGDMNVDYYVYTSGYEPYC